MSALGAVKNLSSSEMALADSKYQSAQPITLITMPLAMSLATTVIRFLIALVIVALPMVAQCV